MSSAIAVNHHNFATEVLEKSHQKPVLVDFYATWCGPCKMLAPMLERLVQEYDVVLAKVDIDENPDLAQTYGVQGVPDVRIAIAGEMKEGFVGVLPEAQLRQLLEGLNLQSELDAALEGIYQQAEKGHIEVAQATLNELRQRYPDHRGLILEAANFYLETGQLETAEDLLLKIQEYEKDYFPKAKLLKALIFFKRTATETEPASDLDRSFQTAAQWVLQQDYQAALDTLLEMVGKDRVYRSDGARKAMLSVFDILGDDHPLTKEYRKKLMMALY
jgi:putative thioredoxin